MKALWLAALALFIPGFASAAPPPPTSMSKSDLLAWSNTYIRAEGWTLADAAADGIWFIKPATIGTPQRGRERIWLRIELLPHAMSIPNNPYIGASRRTLLELDCLDWRYSILEAKRFTLNNLGGPSVDEAGTSEWTYAAPDTPIDDIMKFVCPAK